LQVSSLANGLPKKCAHYFTGHFFKRCARNYSPNPRGGINQQPFACSFPAPPSKSPAPLSTCQVRADGYKKLPEETKNPLIL